MKPIFLFLRLLALPILLLSIEEVFAGDPLTEPYLWEDATPIAQDWKHSEWYGYFSDKAYPWIWHSDHGWQWCASHDKSSVFLWDQKLDSWTWTSSSIYPWIYKSGTNEGWMYYFQINPDGYRSFFHCPSEDFLTDIELRSQIDEASSKPLPQPIFSTPGKTFVGSKVIALSSIRADAGIRYTLDGSIPTDTSPAYTGPLVIGKTTQVRARLYLPGAILGPVASEIYIAIDPDLKNFNSSLPIVLIETWGRNIDAEVYPRLTENPWPQRPVSAIILDTNESTDRASIMGNPDFAGRAGMRIRGNSSQSHFPKKSYKFEIWDEEDVDMDVSLLGFPEDSDWILYAPYTDKTLMRNYLTYSWSRKMGNYATRTQYLEVFANMDGYDVISQEDYLGVYVLMEKYKRHKDRIDIDRLNPTDLEEPEISGGYILKADWGEDFHLDKTNLNIEFVTPKIEELVPVQMDWIAAYLDRVESALYANNFHDPVTGKHYTELLDPYSAIERQIIQELTKNLDGHSTFLSKDRNGPLRFGPVWDYNYALGNNDISWIWCRDCGGVCPCYTPEGWATFYYSLINIGTMRWWARLKEDPDYCQYWADRWAELRSDILSTESILDEMDALHEVLKGPAARNFDRWPILNQHIHGNSFWGTSEAPHTYEDEIIWLKDWLMVRLAWLDSQFLKCPLFNQDENYITSGFALEITNPNPSGTIYYTLDGTDPRVPVQWPVGNDNGIISSHAREYVGPVSLENTTEVNSRVLINDQWSPLRREVFATSAAVDNLRITEIHYHPEVADGEFIELQNVGITPIELNQIRFTDGIEHTFTERTLLPGEVVLLVSNQDCFESIYGTGYPVIGTYWGRLNNAGEHIELVDAINQVILEFAYSDDWASGTDGDGHSLVFINPKGADPASWNSGENWRASESIGGSPGRPSVSTAR